MLFATLNSVMAIALQLAVALDQSVALGVRLEVIGRLDEGDARLLGEHLRDTRRPNSGCVLMPEPTAVPPTGNSRTGRARLARPARPTAAICRAKPPNSWPSRSGVASARCVRPILMISSHSLALSAQHSRADRSQCRQQLLLDRHRDRHVDRRRKRVVCALAHVDVVVRMDRLGRRETVPAHASRSPDWR